MSLPSFLNRGICWETLFCLALSSLFRVMISLRRLSHSSNSVKSTLSKRLSRAFLTSSGFSRIRLMSSIGNQTSFTWTTMLQG